MLFKTLDDIKKYFNFLAQTKVEFLKPHIERAEQKHIRRVLGAELFTLLNQYVETENPTPNEHYNALLNYVRPPLGAYAVKDAVSQLNLLLTNSGFATTQTNGLAPASKQRTDDLKAELHETAADGIETLIAFLEENKANYPQWVTGEGYTLANRNLVNNAVEFFNYLDLDISRLLFTRLRSVMDNVEALQIAPVISANLLAEIKDQIKNNNVSANNKAILPNLQRALANLAMATYIPDETGEQQSVADKYNINAERRKHFSLIGTQYLSAAADTIKANPDNYPAYKLSTQYTAPQTPFENTEDSSLYIFGG